MFARRYFPARHFAPRYWPGIGATAAPSDPSDDRNYTVAAEDRLYTVASEQRRFTIASEDRMFTIDPEDRNLDS